MDENDRLTPQDIILMLQVGRIDEMLDQTPHPRVHLLRGMINTFMACVMAPDADQWLRELAQVNEAVIDRLIAAHGLTVPSAFEQAVNDIIPEEWAGDPNPPQEN